MNKPVQYNSWLEATRQIGLVFMLIERIFYILKWISPRDILAYINRRAKGESVVKFQKLYAKT